MSAIRQPIFCLTLFDIQNICMQNNISGGLHMHAAVESIRVLCEQNGIPVFGIGDSSLLERSPEGYRPSDSLPGAKSMVCLGMPVPKGVLQQNDRSNAVYGRTANIYYRKMDSVLLQLSCLLETSSASAQPVFG